MKKKILIVTTISNTINAFLVPHIESLVSSGNEVELCCKVVKPLSENLSNLVVHEIDFSRSIFDKSNISAYKQAKSVLIKGNYDLIMTHTPIASAMIRFIAKRMNLKVIYTAHGFHFFKGASIVSWMFYYPIEKYLSKYTSGIVTINQEDYEIATKMTKKYTTQVYKINGIGTEIRFSKMNTNQKEQLKKELGIENKKIAICIAELSKRKNQISLLKMISNLKRQDIVLLVVGTGPLKRDYEKFVKDNRLENKIKFLGFRNDIHNLLQISDILLSSSKQEGLPVNIMEGMAHGLPIVASNIRGHVDLLKDYKNGILFSSEEELVDCFYECLEMKNVNYDMKKYNVESAVVACEEIYKKILRG